MENIKLSNGFTLETFNEGIADIGQFEPDDIKVLKGLARKGVLIQFKKQWYPNMGTLRNAWIKPNSPRIMRHDKENGLLWFNY